MSHPNNCEPPCQTQAPVIPVDHLTDIMLGRGPTCYNNPGNRVFRKLVTANAIYYKSKARRKDKAALVELLISKIEANGCRFLHRSSCGTWVEALTTMVKKKVGHALRDARLAADKVGGETNVLPRNFRPAIPDQKHTTQGMSFSAPTADIKQTEERRIAKSETKDKISFGTNPECNDCRMDQQKSFMDLMASSGFPRYLIQDTMMANSSMTIQEEKQAIQHDNAPSFLKLLDFQSQPCTLAERRCEQHSLDFFDREIESLDLCEGCDDVSYIPEPTPLRPTFCWDVEGVDDRDRIADDLHEHGALHEVSPHITRMHDTHVVGVLHMALNMYGRFKESSGGCLADDSSQSSVRSFDYGHNVC